LKFERNHGPLQHRLDLTWCACVLMVDAVNKRIDRQQNSMILLKVVNG